MPIINRPVGEIGEGGRIWGRRVHYPGKEAWEEDVSVGGRMGIGESSAERPEWLKIDIPEWLSEQAQAGYGMPWMRGQYMTQAVPFSTEASRGLMQVVAQQGMTGLQGGFQQQVRQQLEADKQFNLRQLWSAIETGNEQARQRAADRIEAINLENRKLAQVWEQTQDEAAMQREMMRWQYEQSMMGQQAQEYGFWGSLIGGGAGLGAGLLSL